MSRKQWSRRSFLQASAGTTGAMVAARSIALLEFISNRFKIPAARMSVAGYADTVPVASNETEEGRARNRRADIVIHNEQGVVAEPKQARSQEPGVR